jgi:myo-inositol-1(or 4)-monophosphatase
MKRISSIAFSLPDQYISELFTIAGRAALEAGNALRNLFQQPYTIHFKDKFDLVTNADIASEEIILTLLDAEQNGTKVLAEESRALYDEPPLEAVWIVDPLDGTTNFVHGLPWFAVSIAYLDKGKCEIGIIYAPMQDELFCACRGQGAWLNGESIRVSEVADLSQALLATGFPCDVHLHPEPVLGALENLLIHSQGIRRGGAAALDLAAVACGRLDGFWEIKLKPWDTAAGKLLVEEAGGKVTDFNNEIYSPFVPEIACSNGRIHDQIIKQLRAYSNNS